MYVWPGINALPLSCSAKNASPSDRICSRSGPDCWTCFCGVGILGNGFKLSDEGDGLTRGESYLPHHLRKIGPIHTLAKVHTIVTSDSRSRLILLTGATGFVGRQVLRALVERNCKVRLIVRDASYSKVVPSDAIEAVITT